MTSKKIECFGEELYVYLAYTSSGYGEQITMYAMRLDRTYCVIQQFARYLDKPWLQIGGYMDKLSNIERNVIRGVLIDLGRTMGDLRQFICVHELFFFLFLFKYYTIFIIKIKINMIIIL